MQSGIGFMRGAQYFIVPLAWVYDPLWARQDGGFLHVVRTTKLRINQHVAVYSSESSRYITQKENELHMVLVFVLY